MPESSALASEISLEKLICQLETVYPGRPITHGTGFLINIPHLKKLCVLTAGHNIVNQGNGRASQIVVKFPGTDIPTWTAEGFERGFFTDPEWSKPGGSNDSNWLHDWGIILGPEKSRPPENENMAREFGFTIDSRTTNRTIHVHGFPQGSNKLSAGRGVAKFEVQRITYPIQTREGMSGGPVWMLMKHGDPHLRTVIGVHNYDGKATRLSLDMLRQILFWTKADLETDQATRLDAVIAMRLNAVTVNGGQLRLTRTNPRHAAIAFLNAPDTKFDIIPIHVGPSVGPSDGQAQEKEYLYIITPSLSASASSPAFLSISEQSSPDASRSARFVAKINKDTKFHVDKKGTTGMFKIASGDKEWTLFLEKPENLEKFTDWSCGHITPISDGAKFIKKGGPRQDPAYSFIAG